MVQAPIADGKVAAFVGPAMSYYEYTTTGFKRLTDWKWRNTQRGLCPQPKRHAGCSQLGVQDSK